MNPTTTFISYAHEDKPIRDRIILSLEQVNPVDGPKLIEVLTDDHAKRGAPLHKEISRLVNKSHVVVPIITKSWLDSHETRDELVRAHERRKFIICLVSNESGVSTERLPFYVRDSLNIHFDDADIDLKIKDLVDEVKKFEEHWKLDLFEHIRKLGDWVDEYPQLPLYKLEHLRDAFNRAKADVSAVVEKDEFRCRVSYEQNFLIAASPYFRTANEIYAVSIAKISTFWHDQKVHQAVERYLMEQGRGKKVVRLFVFESPREVNDFKNILEANYQHYGRAGGGVFVTSGEVYKRLIRERVTRDENFNREIEYRDFGVLTFGDGDGRVCLYAVLDLDNLRFSKINLDGFEETHLQAFVSLMSKLLSIDEGDFNSEYSIVRWSPIVWKDPERLGKVLNALFGDQPGRIRHFVLIKSNSNRDRVRECLNNLLFDFHSKKEDLAIREIWMNERHDFEPRDARFNGSLSIEADFDFMLGVDFDDEDSLKRYYQHPIHSIHREKLYCEIDPESKKVFHQLGQLAQKRGGNKEAMKQFEEVEAKMRQFILRIDVRLQERVDEIVKRRGLPFGSRYQT